MKLDEFRMYCGKSDGLAGTLRIMSTAEHPNFNKMHDYMIELEAAVKRMRKILDEVMTENRILHRTEGVPSTRPS